MFKRGFIFLMSILLTLVLTGCNKVDSSKMDEVDSLMEEASSLMDKQMYYAAIETYEDIIHKDSSYDKAYLELAKAYKLVESSDLVEDIVKEGIYRGQDTIQLELYLIDLYTEWLEYESAEKVAMEVLKKHPKNREAYERLLNILDLKNEQDRILEIHEEYKGKIKSDGNIIDIISLSDFPGYPYDFKLVDANNDGSLDILVVIHSGGTSDLRAIILEMVNYWMMTWDTCTIPT